MFLKIVFICLLFFLFLLVYTYVLSAYFNCLYDLIIMLVFFLVLTLGFVFELGKNALKISSKQNQLTNNSIIYPVLFDSPYNKQKSSNKRFGSKRSFIIR